MASLKLTNTLLVLVVLCLAVIAAKLSNVQQPVAEAAVVEAKPSAHSAMVGCYMQGGNCEWRYIRVTNDGFLWTLASK